MKKQAASIPIYTSFSISFAEKKEERESEREMGKAIYWVYFHTYDFERWWSQLPRSVRPRMLGRAELGTRDRRVLAKLAKLRLLSMRKPAPITVKWLFGGELVEQDVQVVV